MLFATPNRGNHIKEERDDAEEVGRIEGTREEDGEYKDIAPAKTRNE